MNGENSFWLQWNELALVLVGLDTVLDSCYQHAMMGSEKSLYRCKSLKHWVTK